MNVVSVPLVSQVLHLSLTSQSGKLCDETHSALIMYNSVIGGGKS